MNRFFIPKIADSESALNNSFNLFGNNFGKCLGEYPYLYRKVICIKALLTASCFCRFSWHLTRGTEAVTKAAEMAFMPCCKYQNLFIIATRLESPEARVMSKKCPINNTSRDLRSAKWNPLKLNRTQILKFAHAQPIRDLRPAPTGIEIFPIR